MKIFEGGISAERRFGKPRVLDTADRLFPVGRHISGKLALNQKFPLFQHLEFALADSNRGSLDIDGRIGNYHGFGVIKPASAIYPPAVSAMKQ
jgi:hypothetical protein